MATLPRRVKIELTPIGTVRSPYASVLDAPRQGEYASKRSVIEVEGAFAEGLVGLEPGDELLVLWWAHQADRKLLKRPDSNGVFTMRAPHRPNPIALSHVRVVAREGPGGTRLTVEGLDAIDGTPVLDLKSARAEADGWFGLPGLDLDG